MLQGDVDEAFQGSEKAIELDPNHEAAWVLKGVILTYLKGNLAKPFRHLMKPLRLILRIGRLEIIEAKL
ncbi:MAG: hypothetical protein LUQ38_07975 [Methanotrichaceae archaeon]|nr:hypothetical protein [Methanotrichaceae archaeon]